MDSIQAYRPIARLVPEHWRRDQFAAGDGQIITYHHTGGSGPAVILLHGFQSAGVTWLRTAKALEGDYHIVMPDLRGHGYSSESLAGFSLERMTEDIAEMIRSLSLERPFVVGHSMGGEIAGRLAAQYPGLVRGVVLVDPPMQVFSAPPVPAGEMPPWMQHWFDTMQAIRSQPHPERLHTVITLMPPGTAEWGEEDLVPYAEACAQLNLGVLQCASMMPYRIATPEISDKIEAPLLLLTGDSRRGSGGTPLGIACLMNGADRAHIAFEDAGHFIPIDQFDRFVAVVRQFFERVQATSSAATDG